MSEIITSENAAIILRKHCRHAAEAYCDFCIAACELEGAWQQIVELETKAEVAEQQLAEARQEIERLRNAATHQTEA